LRERDAVGARVGTDHATARRREDLRRELAEEPETDHDRGLTDLRRRAAHALHRDGADGGEARGAKIRTVRYAHDQIARHADDLGVVRVRRAARRDAVAGAQIHHVAPDLADDAGHAVAHRRGDPVAELRLAEHLLQSARAQPLDAELRELERLVDARAQVRAGHRRRLGAGADHRPRDVDRDLAGSAGGRRRVLDLDRAALREEDLPHLASLAPDLGGASRALQVCSRARVQGGRTYRLVRGAASPPHRRIPEPP
jgi:hypothetical protein